MKYTKVLKFRRTILTILLYWFEVDDGDELDEVDEVDEVDEGDKNDKISCTCATRLMMPARSTRLEIMTWSIK